MADNEVSPSNATRSPPIRGKIAEKKCGQTLPIKEGPIKTPTINSPITSGIFIFFANSEAMRAVIRIKPIAISNRTKSVCVKEIIHC